MTNAEPHGCPRRVLNAKPASLSPAMLPPLPAYPALTCDVRPSQQSPTLRHPANADRTATHCITQDDLRLKGVLGHPSLRKQSEWDHHLIAFPLDTARGDAVYP